MSVTVEYTVHCDQSGCLARYWSDLAIDTAEVLEMAEVEGGWECTTGDEPSEGTWCPDHRVKAVS